MVKYIESEWFCRCCSDLEFAYRYLKRKSSVLPLMTRLYAYDNKTLLLAIRQLISTNKLTLEKE